MTVSLQEKEHELVSVARGLGEKIRDHTTTLAGLNAAEASKGLVVTDEASAILAVDYAAAIADAEKFVKKQESRALDIPKQMQAAIKGVTGPLRSKLAVALDAAKAANQRWIDQRKKAELADRERRNAEAAAAASAAAKRAAPGEDVPPPAEAELAPTGPTSIAGRPMVVGSGGRMQYETRKLSCQMVAWRECDEEWLKVELRSQFALARFRVACERGEVSPPTPERPRVVWRGVEFWYKTSMVQK